MIRHMFMCPIKEGVTEEKVNESINDLRLLQEKVPEIIQLTVGKNLGWYDKKMTVAFVADFENEDGWNSFMKNEEHLQIGAKVSEVLDFESIVSAQIEV